MLCVAHSQAWRHCGSVDFTARSEIVIKTEFSAENGSEVHIYPSLSFPDCPDFTGYARSVGNALSVINNEDENINEIEINFKKISNQFNVQINPNPNNGKFEIALLGNSTSLIDINILDLLGKNILSSHLNNSINEIDLSFLPKGVYCLQIQNSNNSIYKKIIIQ